MTQQGQGDVVALEDRVRKMTHSLPPSDLGSTRAIQAITAFVEDELVRLLTLLSSLGGEQGWRTIDSAPKDRLIDIWIAGKDGSGTRWADCYYDEITDQWRTSRPGGRLVYVSARNVTHWMPLPSAPGSVPTSLAGQVPDDAKEDAAAAYFRSAIADGQAAVLLADLATYDNVLRELGIQESYKHPVDEVRRIQRVAEAAHHQGVETVAKLIDRKVSDYTSEHGSLDPETGAMEFSRSGEEYVSTLEELAEEIRAMLSAAPQPTAVAGQGPDDAEHVAQLICDADEEARSLLTAGECALAKCYLNAKQALCEIAYGTSGRGSRTDAAVMQTIAQRALGEICEQQSSPQPTAGLDTAFSDRCCGSENRTGDELSQPTAGGDA